MMGLSKAVSDFQFFNINNEEIPEHNNICRWIPGLFYCMMHIIVRLVTYSFLVAYYHQLSLILLSIQVALNFVIECNVNREKDAQRSFMTAFLSLVAPGSYALENDKLNRKFCRWQCITFGINLALSTSLLNVLSCFEVIDINKLPKSATSDLGLEKLHQNTMGWGGLSIVLLTIIISGLAVLHIGNALVFINYRSHLIEKLRLSKNYQGLTNYVALVTVEILLTEPNWSK